MVRPVTQFGARDFLRIPEGQRKDLPKTPDVQPQAPEVSLTLRTTPTEPGDRYEIFSRVDDVGEPILGIKKTKEATRVLILKRTKKDSNRFLQTFHQLQHPNIAVVIEAFQPRHLCTLF
jgi:hypothetical protein